MSEELTLPAPRIKMGERVLPDPAELDLKWSFRKWEPFLGLAEGGRQVSLAPHHCNACQVLIKIIYLLMVVKLCLHTGTMEKCFIFVSVVS